MPKGNPKNPEIIRQYWREASRRYRERKRKAQAERKTEGEVNQ